MLKKILILSILTAFLSVGMVQGQSEELPDPGMLPDHPFYFLKNFFEGVGTFFTFGELTRTERFFNLAERRLAEARALAEKGKSDIAERATNRYQEKLSQALNKAEEARMRGLDVDEVMARVSEATLRHQQVLADVYERVPEEAREAIGRAMEAGMRGHEEALRSLSEERMEEIMPQIEQKRYEFGERIRALRAKGIRIPLSSNGEELEEVFEEALDSLEGEIPENLETTVPDLPLEISVDIGGIVPNLPQPLDP